MRYFVWDENVPMPISCQPDEGYTLTEAIARYNREVNQLMRLFPDATRKEIESDFTVRTQIKVNKITGGEIVL